MRRILTALLVGLFVVSAAGCQKTAADRLIGSWSGKPDENGAAWPMTYSFHKGGKLSVKMIVSMKGTWDIASEEGDEAVVHITADRPGSDSGTDTSFKIRFLNDDEFAMIHPDDGRVLSKFVRGKK